ncbi:hypothetical protein BN159_8423 [Streptomyces davaonensis JCM 4913]|uniref:Transposase IS110-like N-terminal domain-containing protein n=1 Tax=Streptomyces davaonensis (strain DSM 101723 / JCM 4913 / KCC S-0913 / 768) TaxID=1214101 RepID=K4R965_STRDJ|nr:hypothetical protein BN159_8423 [Streptomyces davaonensis JCM 4913]
MTSGQAPDTRPLTVLPDRAYSSRAICPFLLMALLANHGQPVVYVPGRTVNHMSASYRGQAKTDARDAYVIADTVRLRREGFWVRTCQRG